MSLKRGLVIGCGGTLGGAWTIAALKALSNHLDWDPRTADLLQGTSAGAELVTMIGSGVSVDDLVAMQRGTAQDPRLRAHLAATPGMLPPLPRPKLGSALLPLRASGLVGLSGLAPVGAGDPTWLQRLADSFAPGGGWVSHKNTRLVAVNYRTGERVAFGAPGSPSASIGEALRASWGIPGWFPPVEIGGSSYVDGGVASTASLDLVADAGLDEVIVVVSMASLSSGSAPGPIGAAEWLLRRRMTATLRKEIAVVEQTGTRVVVVDVTAEDLAVMGGNFMDHRRRSDVFEYSMSALAERVTSISMSGVTA
ncbi:patatin-like phospholipase family protein [Smaragdicoccus niigatensis]|uniref:patatin-like phospholipase family protein n=1 Tax=Smaragdicoccus niigatensis TaxID=359359 RepID=UPI00039D4133|nr:patatin-like phospholipase family protein [Smaragdicoccus niigatensis]